jgi:hypothetical protein
MNSKDVTYSLTCSDEKIFYVGKTYRLEFRLHSVLVQPQRERGHSPLMSIPPFRRGFLRHQDLPIRCGPWKNAEGKPPRSVHRFHEATGRSLGLVASPHGLLPFRPARSL